jgi:predicted dehydrogenase
MLVAGLSGCGARGAEVMAQVRMHAHCRIGAVHDPDPAALQRIGSIAAGAARCASFEQLLGTGIDFVILAGPCGVRAPQVEAAAAQGVHCLLHTPMAPDAAAAAAMLDACDRGGVKLGVAVPGEADPLLEQIRQMIADDWLGGTVLVQSLWAEDRALRDPPGTGHWLRDPARAGNGALLQLAAHHVHLATWLTGRSAVQVTAQESRGFSALGQDGGAATALLRGGVLCTFTASHLTRGSTFAIYGTDGGVRITNDRLWLRGQREFRGDLFDYLAPGQETSVLRADVAEAVAARAPDCELHGRFARWIDDLDDFPCPGEQAAHDLRTLDAMRRSIASGRVETVAG